MKRVTLTIDEETLKLFKKIIKENKTSMSQMLRRFIIDYEQKKYKMD